MEVILLQDIKGVGRRGELVNTSEGYARNFLIPRKLASIADKQTKHQVREKSRAEMNAKKKEVETSEDFAKKLKNQALEFNRPSNNEGVLYASLKENEIQAKLNENFSSLPKSTKVKLNSPIKETGTAEITVEFLSGISTKIKVIVKGTHG